MITFKIVFSTDTLSRGGKERQLCLLFSQLSEKKYNKLIFAKKRNFNKENNYLSEYGIDDKSVSFFVNYREYKNLIKKHKPDVIFSWDGITSLYNLLLHRKYNFIFINGSVRHGLRLLKLSHLFRSIMLWLSPYVIANSFSGLKVNNLKQNNRNFVLYNGIDLKKTEVLAKEDKNILKKELLPFIDIKNTLFVSVANFIPFKDYSTVLKALSELKNRINFTYIIIGDGPLRSEIEEQTEKLGLKDNVHIIGRTTNVKKYLRISDIFIHSSKGEGISNAILEAMICGLPVVSSDVGGVPETVYGITSFLYKYKDKEGLKNCIAKAMELTERNISVDEKYINHLKKFSAESMVNNFCSILDKIHNK